MYAETDFWLALLKNDDRLAERAEDLLAAHGDELTVSLATFLELFLVEERYGFDREQAVTSILELANFPGDESVVYQASASMDDGLDTFDAFHAALADDAILSSDQAFESLSLERVPLEPDA